MADDLQPGGRVRWTERGLWFSGRVMRRLVAAVVIKEKRCLRTCGSALAAGERARDHAAHPPAADERADPVDARQGEPF